MEEAGQARQQHGMDFEKWVKETFFESYIQTGYTDKWDATNVAFKSKYAAQTNHLQNLPISMKSCKYGTSIGFGDALRQYQNAQDFLLIIGFWNVSGDSKNYVAVQAVKIDARKWHQLFVEKVTPGELKNDVLDSETTQDKIYNLDRVIKTTPNYKDARTLAKAGKKDLPEIDITLNPKIDSKNQRRLQCSLPFETFWREFAGEPPFSNPNCTLWNEKVPLLK